MLVRLAVLALSWLAVGVQGIGPWNAQWHHLRLRFLQERSSDPVSVASVTATTNAFVDTVIVENRGQVPLESLELEVLSRPDSRQPFVVSATRAIDVHINPRARESVPVGLLPATQGALGTEGDSLVEVVVCPVQVRFAGGAALDLNCEGVEDRLKPLGPRRQGRRGLR